MDLTRVRSVNDYDCLAPSERAQLEKLKRSDPFCARTFQQVERMFESDWFKRVRQEARGLLLFIVGKKLLGRQSDIKQSTIGVHVYGKPADHDWSQDSTVRVAAASLRERLKQYYKDDGQDDAIEISIPTGTFVPEIRDRLITIAVARLDNWNPGKDQDHLCAAASDEVAHRLNAYDSVEAQRVTALEHTNHGTRYGFHGSLACYDGLLRLNISVSDLERGHVIFCETIEGPRHALLKVSQQAGDAAVRLLREKAREPIQREKPVARVHLVHANVARNS